MKELTEHLWSGIIHRSETGETRKEDNVDLLDWEQFEDYLNDHYKIAYYDTVACTMGNNFIRLSVNGCSVLLKLNNHIWELIIFAGHREQNLIVHNLLLNKMVKDYIVKILEDNPNRIKYETNIKTNKGILRFINDFIKMPKLEKFNIENMIKKVK